jgi:predicted nucleic acid-binding protein
MMAVSNTSPLILLDKVGHLFLLEQLFPKVIIPPAVDKEWLRPGGYSVPSWLSIEPLTP